MEKRKGVAFFDIAGTISFQSKHNKMLSAVPAGDGLVDLNDPATGEICRVIATPIHDYVMYTDPETIKLLEELKCDYLLVYVTGSRMSTMEKFRPVLPVPHATLLESGAVIWRQGYGDPDDVWAQKIRDEIRDLMRVVADLKSEGWIISDEGRTSAARIFPESNPSRSQADFADIERRIAGSEPSLKTTWNIGGLDILPRSAGKGNAVRYFMSLIGCSFEEAIGVGDDINDLEMLEEVKERLIVRSIHQPILRIAHESQWFVSEGYHFKGINEIIRNLINR